MFKNQHRSCCRYDGHKKEAQKNQQINEEAARVCFLIGKTWTVPAYWTFHGLQDLEKAINNVLIKTANAIYTSKLLEKELSGLYKNIEVFEKAIGG